MQAFILAGGFATRLWPLTEKRAKPLLPLAGKPILTHMVENIPATLPITVSTNAVFAESFHAWKNTLGRANIDMLIEDTRGDAEKLGALGATARWIADRAVADDVLLLTGDNYLSFSLREFLDTWKRGTSLLAAHDIGDREQARSFGTILTDPANAHRVIGFEEKPREPKTTLVSAGCSVLPMDALPVLISFAKAHPDNMGTIFEEFLRRGLKVHCFTFRSPWFDIGSFSSYLEATKALVQKPLIDPTALVNDVTCEGSVVIGPHSVVRKATLRDTVIFGHSQIEDCILEECILDEGCRLRGIDLQGKMLRTGTVLEK